MTSSEGVTSESASQLDRWRQVTVVAGAIICVVGSAIGVGAFGGTSIENAAGGALGPDATLLAPASGAFSIWTVVYFGLIAYAVWQLLPRQRSHPRQRSLGWLLAASMVLNAAWILVIQAGWLWLSIVVICALVVVLGVAFVRASRSAAASRLEAVVVDGTLGIYLGWVCVAICANVTAALVAAGFDGWGLPAEVWAGGVLLVVALVGFLLARRGGGRWSVAAALVWGLGWIAVSRLTGELVSGSTAAAAVAAAVIIATATVVIRFRPATAQ